MARVLRLSPVLIELAFFWRKCGLFCPCLGRTSGLPVMTGMLCPSAPRQRRSEHTLSERAVTTLEDARDELLTAVLNTHQQERAREALIEIFALVEMETDNG